jgi:hypothetical protein
VRVEVKALERGERDGGWMMDDESAVQYIVSREIHGYYVGMT